MNVYFKRGTQAELNTLKQGGVFVQGAFYLTSDTNRLCFAQSSSSLVDLNQYIHNVSNVANLPSSNVEEGDFYYVTGSNILAVRSGNSWVQINPDTKVSGITNSMTTVGNTTNGVVAVTTTISNARADGVVQEDKTSHFDIVGGDNITLTINDQGQLVITGHDTTTNTTYDLDVQTNSDEGRIRLVSSDSDEGSDIVKVVGHGGVDVSSNATTGEVIVSAQDPIDTVVNSFSSAGALTTTISFDHTSTNAVNTPAVVSQGITPTIAYGPVTANDTTTYPTTATFNSGTANLDVYTTTQIDSMFDARLSSFDAMQYKGTIDNTNAATILGSNDRVAGDTYKASAPFSVTVGGHTISAEIGDLIIAGGSDSNIVWDVVPSGDEQLLAINATTGTNVITFTDTNYDVNTGRDQNIGTITFAADQTATNASIGISTTAAGTGGKNVTVTLAHGAHGTGTAQTYTAVTSARTSVTGTALTIPTVSAISLDANGHVASIETVNYQVTDTHASLESSTFGTAASSNVGTVTLSTKLDSDLTATSTAFQVTSDNLKITNTNVNNVQGLKVNLEWESF